MRPQQPQPLASRQSQADRIADHELLFIDAVAYMDIRSPLLGNRCLKLRLAAVLRVVAAHEQMGATLGAYPQ